jgi:hypothetical protein
LGKATILTPLYISVAWVFITTYQLFTQTTVTTVTAQIQTYLPTIGTYLATKLDVITFIHSFAWIFLLSSVIPSVLLGKERGVLAQFGVCLALSFLAFAIQDVLTGFNGTLDQILGLAPLFQNPALAAAYLSVPYLLMVGFDIQSKRKRKEWITVERKSDDFLEDFPITEEDFFEEEEKAQEDEYVYAT